MCCICFETGASDYEFKIYWNVKYVSIFWFMTYEWWNVVLFKALPAMVHPSIREGKPIPGLFIESTEKAIIINDGETSNLSSWLPLLCSVSPKQTSIFLQSIKKLDRRRKRHNRLKRVDCTSHFHVIQVTEKLKIWGKIILRPMS